MGGVYSGVRSSTKIEKVKGLDKEHTCITHGYRQQSGDSQKKGGEGDLEAKWGTAGTSVIVSPIKKF